MRLLLSSSSFSSIQDDLDAASQYKKKNWEDTESTTNTTTTTSTTNATKMINPKKNPRKSFLQTLQKITKETDVVTVKQQQQQQQQQEREKQINPFIHYSLEEIEKLTAASRPRKEKDAMVVHERYDDGIDDTYTKDDNDNDDDALFLEPDVYVKMGNHINADGSIRQWFDENQSRIDSDNNIPTVLDRTIDQKYRQLMQNFLETIPIPPESIDELDLSFKHSAASTTSTFTTDAAAVVAMAEMNTENPTMEDVWELLRKQGSHTTNNYTDAHHHAEVMHQRIMNEEATFWSQSQLFRESLLDSSKADAAAIERHGYAYRKRQQEAIQQLESQIADFEQTILPKLKVSDDTVRDDHQLRHQHWYCSQCRCLLSRDEIAQTTASQHRWSNPLPRENRLCSVCSTPTTRRRDMLLGMLNRKDVVHSQNHTNPTNNITTASSSSSIFTTVPTLPSSPTTTTTTTMPMRTPYFTEKDNNSHNNQNMDINNNDDEEQYVRNVKREAVVPSPWLAVVDPDTREIFYWNEDTEEMRWDLDDDGE